MAGETRQRNPGLECVGVMASMMLICAVASSLALGVLLAYGICRAMFRVFRVQAMAAARERAAKAAASVPAAMQTVEG